MYSIISASVNSAEKIYLLALRSRGKVSGLMH